MSTRGASCFHVRWPYWTVLLAAIMPDTASAQMCLAWRERAIAPQGREGHALAYDGRRQVVVLFGGLPGDAPGAGDTWEWNGIAWSRRSRVGPAPRYGHAMAYDEHRGVVVLFGGWSSDQGDTWEWDGDVWSLRSVNGPQPRASHCMTYDSVRHVTLLFGGIDADRNVPYLGDTWQWDGSNWSRLEVPGPGGRRDASLAFDSSRGVAVLFGGVRPTGSAYEYLPDTWEWDGSEWAVRSQVDPTEGGGHSITFDPVLSRTLLVGGKYCEYFDPCPMGLWMWDGSEWTFVVRSGPEARTGHTIVYDAARDKTLLFGGTTLGGAVAKYMEPGDTWTWNRSAWEWVDHGVPGVRRASAAAFDASRGVTVLVGGLEWSGFHAGTWEWDGGRWTLRHQDGPDYRAFHALSFDSWRSRTVMFGGWPEGAWDEQTWEWDGSEWLLVGDSGPSDRAGSAMAFDSSRGVTVLFDGAGKGDTWEWDGVEWRLRSVTGPSPRGQHAMAFDVNRHVTTLFGGIYNGAPYGDTWEWDGASWKLVSISGPPARRSHQMAFDSSRGLAFLFGGLADQPLRDTWAWDGETWYFVDNRGPEARFEHAMSFDAQRSAGLVFGGIGANWQYLGDTWELSESEEAIAADADADCDIDLRDVALFLRCFGSDVVQPACASFDAEPDAVIGLADWTQLARALGGPVHWPAP